MKTRLDVQRLLGLLALVPMLAFAQPMAAANVLMQRRT